MDKEKENAIKIYVMIVSAIKFIDAPSPKVSALSRHIFKGLKSTFLKSKAKTSIRKSDDEYTRINSIVMEAWDKTREELIDPKKLMESSMSEIIQVLWDRLERNKYKNLYVGSKKIEGAINSIKGCHSLQPKNEAEQLETELNSRKLADRFLELCDIPKSNGLKTRMAILRENIIIERG